MTTSVPAEARPMQLLDWGLLSFAAGVWGASFLFTAIALDNFAPGLVTALRVWFGCLALLLLPGSLRPVPREAWPRIALLGVTWMAFPLTLFPIAQQWIDSSVAGMLNSGMPLMTTVMAVTLFGGSIGRTQIIGVLVGFVGIALIALPTASTGATTAVGVLLVVLAVTSYGYAANLAGPLQQQYGALPVVTRALAVASVLVAPWGLVGLSGSEAAADSLVANIALGVGGTGLAYAAAAALGGRVGAVRMSVVTYLVPLVAIVLGAVFRDERLTMWTAAGTAVVLAGAYLATRAAPAPATERSV